MQRKLYDWQEECLDRWFANKGRGIVQAVTGSGKTLLALTAIDRLDKKLNGSLHVKIVVPTGTLMQQWNKALHEYLAAANGQNEHTVFASASLRHAVCSEIGLCGGGFKSAPNHKYMIYVINSARYELARQILSELKQGKNVLLIADECHHYESGQNRLIFEFLPHSREYADHFFSLGLSATLPAGQGVQYLTSVLGRKIYHYGIREASTGNTICPCHIYHISLSLHPDERDEYNSLSDQMKYIYGILQQKYPSLNQLSQKERFEFLKSLAGGSNRKAAEMAASYMNLTFMRKRLVCLASARLSCACDLIRRLDTTEKILVFSERISQAEELYRILIQEYPEKVGRYHSKMGSQANRNTLERFRTGSLRILVACKAIDEGLDVPDAAIGIILSGTSTQRQRIQRLGRVIRRQSDKDKASLYYLHITETSEDSCYLPDAQEHRLFELTYDDASGQFCNPDYDRKACTLLEEMKHKETSADVLQEAVRCLQLGCVRSDWKLEPSVLEERIRNARYTDEKNYWVCMKKLASQAF